MRSWVGHVDRDILKLYTHIADAGSQSAMKRFAEAYNSLNSKDKEQADDSHDPESKSAHSQHKAAETENGGGAT